MRSGCGKFITRWGIVSSFVFPMFPGWVRAMAMIPAVGVLVASWMLTFLRFDHVMRGVLWATVALALGIGAFVALRSGCRAMAWRCRVAKLRGEVLEHLPETLGIGFLIFAGGFIAAGVLSGGLAEEFVVLKRATGFGLDLWLLHEFIYCRWRYLALHRQARAESESPTDPSGGRSGTPSGP